jgi:5-hydroxyisourate hydrolase
MARLTTHVLDVSRGLAAAGVLIELHILHGADRRPIVQTATNADGRTDAPLLTGDRLEPGVYELTFHAGDYYRRGGVALPSPPFLDTIVVRVGLADATGNYHVPLLLSPYGYSTYRGT